MTSTSPRIKKPARTLLWVLLDVLLVMLGAPVVVVMVALLALVNALDGGRPFYTQQRIGRNGRVYTMWKLR